MKKPEAFNCDVCGVAKGATNHWRVLRVWAPAHSKTFVRMGSLAIYNWDDKGANKPGAVHACGNSCTQKLVERYLQNGNLRAERAGGAA